MFILRRISSVGVQMNITLGTSYTLVSEEKSLEEFKRSYEHQFGDSKQDEEKRVYAFVSSEDGSCLFPLYANQSNYIMTETGKTFANISLLFPKKG